MSQPPGHRKFTSHFAEVPTSRCKELLTQHKIGRVAWNSGDGPRIMPVTYQYRNGMVVFRTAPDGPLASLRRRTPVAFEVDNIDEEHEKGWSVVVLGFSEGVTHSYSLSTLWQSGPVPWAGGDRTVFVTITPQSITGRSVQSPEAD
jgi:nitroimidazol reductase NimA-like FMN-containing flavoprotein (pyridoxamine 5'-phosphate oxidase superfamily)